MNAYAVKEDLRFAEEMKTLNRRINEMRKGKEKDALILQRAALRDWYKSKDES